MSGRIQRHQGCLLSKFPAHRNLARHLLNQLSHKLGVVMLDVVADRRVENQFRVPSADLWRYRLSDLDNLVRGGYTRDRHSCRNRRTTFHAHAIPKWKFEN